MGHTEINCPACAGTGKDIDGQAKKLAREIVKNGKEQDEGKEKSTVKSKAKAKSGSKAKAKKGGGEKGS